MHKNKEEWGRKYMKFSASNTKHFFFYQKPKRFYKKPNSGRQNFSISIDFNLIQPTTAYSNWIDMLQRRSSKIQIDPVAI